MNFRECFWTKEARIVAAMSYDRQVMPSKFYSEGATTRPWLPVEILKYALRRLVEKKIAFKEVVFNHETQQWDSRNFKPQGDRMVAYFSMPRSENAEAKAWIDAIFNWDEAKLKTASDDKEIDELLTTLGFLKVSDRVDMNHKTVVEGDDLMDLMSVDKDLLKKKVAEAEAENAAKNAPVKSFEEYERDMLKEIEDITENIRKVGPKQKTELKKKKDELQAALDDSRRRKSDAAAHMALVNSGAQDKIEVGE